MSLRYGRPRDHYIQLQGSNASANESQPQPPPLIKRKPLPLNSAVLAPQHRRFPSHEPSQALLSAGADDAYALEPLDGDATEVQRPHVHDGWLPLTFKWPFLCLLSLISAILLIVIVILHWYSDTNNGLGGDDDTSILLFGWKFTPTLIAVIYTFLFTVLLDDVKRTEPYARLTNPKGSLGKYSILYVPGAWWDALAQGFSKKKSNGSPSWILAFSASSLILALVVVSPLSSSLLLSTDIVISNQTTFDRVQLGPQSPLVFGNQVIPRFRTLSNVLQNITTSAWINDGFLALPAWRTDLNSAPFGAYVTNSSETWQTETTVIQSDLVCQSLVFLDKKWVNVSNGLEGSTRQGAITLAADNGCLYSLSANNLSAFALAGGVSWLQQSQLLVGLQDTNPNQGGDISLTTLNASEKCSASDETMLMTSSWFVNSSVNDFVASPTWNPDFTISGRMCTGKLYAANISVEIVSSAGGSVIQFDQKAFNDSRVELSNSTVPMNRFNNNFFSTDWEARLYTFSTSTRPTGGGAGQLLLASYNFSLDAIMADNDVLTRASQIKQRYFGESMISALQDFGWQTSEDNAGKVYVTKSRIVVASAVAFTLEAVLLVEVVLSLSLCWLKGRGSRQLALDSDPARTTTHATLIHGNQIIIDTFRNHAESSQETIYQDLGNVSFRLAHQGLSLLTSNKLGPYGDRKGSLRNYSTNWRPMVIRWWALTALLASLLATLIIIAVFFALSRHSDLYQNAFVYTAQLSISGTQLSSIAPYSIIPTLIAVGIGVWWGVVETEFRCLQPFIAMARGPLPLENGADLSYQSSYLLWAAFKAGSRRHWLLSLICVGAFVSQIFTIAMSALWQLEYHDRSFFKDIPRSFEIRTIPHLNIASMPDSPDGADGGSDAEPAVLSRLYGQLQTNWLYGAAIQLSLNGTQPPWSLNGWNFVPLDLSPLNMTVAGNDRSAFVDGTSAPNSIALPSGMAVNVTTPALRGQLRCTLYDALSNQSNWLTQQDFSNATLWNVSASAENLDLRYLLGADNDPSMQVAFDPCCQTSTPILSEDFQITCCENNTEGEFGPTVIAYWSVNSLQDVNYATTSCGSICDQPVNNFTVKWIYGKPVQATSLETGTGIANLAWPMPQMAALNCQPIIEKTNASVLVDPLSTQVLAFELLDEVQVDENAWTDQFVLHFPFKNSSSSGIDTNVTTSYGQLFVQAMLRAGDLANIAGPDNTEPASFQFESMADQTFNFKKPGMNMDFMSYSMYSQVGEDAEALLDPDRLTYYANITFSTFFQQFVSSNLSMTNGGPAYQVIGATLPADLPPVDNYLLPSQPEDVIAPVSYTNRTARVQVIQRVKVLHMSPAAAWLCMLILVWLILTTVFILAVENRYLNIIVRDVKTIADVSILLAGSDKFLDHVRRNEIKSGHGEPGVDKKLRTKLGWFRDQRGQERWGIELYGDEHGVEWLDDTDGKANKRNDGYADVGSVEYVGEAHGHDAIPLQPLKGSSVHARTTFVHRNSYQS